MFHVEQQTGTLAAVLRHLGLPDALLSPLVAYADAVERDADRLGLVSEGGLEDFLTRHVAESLLFAAIRPPVAGERWADIGSGAGLPGIPLAIAYPEIHVTLVEPQQRRAGFLELTVEDLGLANADVVPQRAQQLKDAFNVTATRAFSSSEGSGADDKVLELMRTVTVPGGHVLVQVGQNPPNGEVSSIRVDSVDLEVRFLRMTAE